MPKGRKNALTIYTDGSCWPNPGPGGWAYWIEGSWHGDGFDPQTTNNRMELTAAIEALDSLPDQRIRVDVFCDSQYVCRGFNEWMHSWARYDWPARIANADLWKRLYRLSRSLDVVFFHVRGHSGIAGNEYVDQLAEAARERGIHADS